MYLIKVWEHDEMIFEGKSKIIPKTDNQGWVIKKNENGIVTEASYNPAKYRITYEDTKI
jgi:hypothetical protein